MEEYLTIVLPLILLLILLIIRVPIAFSLGVSAFVGYYMVDGFSVAFNQLGITCYQTMQSFVLAPVAVFILMGEFITISGIGSDLYEAAYKWLGRIRGSLGIASVCACAVFAAMCGVSVASAVAMGRVAIPEMLKRGYDKSLAAGILAAGGTLGILIPPSVTFILYGVVTEESIGRLFIAGVLPGILLTFLYASYVFIRASINPDIAPSAGKILFKEKIISLKPLWSVILLILAVLGSMYSGVCTPSEAAGVGSFFAMIIALLYRKLNWQTFKEVLLHSATISGFIFIIITMAVYFGIYLTRSGGTDCLIEWIISLNLNRWTIMIGINLLLLILGCFMDPSSIILLTGPILHSLVVKLGFDPIWFGVILVINMEMGFITPPMGMNLFAINGIAKDIPFESILKGVVPFLLLDILCIAIIMIFPDIAIWLPSQMLAK